MRKSENVFLYLPWLPCFKSFASLAVATLITLISSTIHTFLGKYLLSLCLYDISDAAAYFFQLRPVHCEVIKNIVFGNNFSNVSSFHCSFPDASFEIVIKSHHNRLFKASALLVFNHIAGSNCRFQLIENCIFALDQTDTIFFLLSGTCSCTVDVIYLRTSMGYIFSTYLFCAHFQ